MRVQLLSETSLASHLVLRTVAIACLLASLMIGTAWPMSASGRVASPAVLPVAGMGATSPLAMRSTRPAGVMLGATGTITPGVNPLVSSGSMGMTACSGPAGGPSSTLPFDGGGLARTILSCADSRLLSSPLLPTSSAGRTGIPLDAIEFGTSGLSVLAPVPGSNASSDVNPTRTP